MTDDRDVVLGGSPDDTGTTKERRGAGLYDALVVVGLTLAAALLGIVLAAQVAPVTPA